MSRLLIAYASTHGHTGRIADRLAATAREAGVAELVWRIGHDDQPDLTHFDAVVVGGSIHLGAHQRALVSWARECATTLAAMPGSFFSVSLSSADDTDEARTMAQGWIDDFEDETGWTPDRSVAFAGAVQYREYDPFTRLLMRLKMSHGGQTTDTSHDTDYTDWDAVEAFGRAAAEDARRAVRI